MSGQAAEKLTIRNLRFYRTQGLLDGPMAGRRYGRRHFLQLASIRILQAHGLPLGKIREVLDSKTDAELHELLRQAKQEGVGMAGGLGPIKSMESMELIGLTGDFLLLCRGRKRPPASVLEKVVEILGGGTSQPPNQSGIM
ncbi:MAG: MerR family transcriptional regulator [Terrimicrobiaceae bacterium]